MENSKIGWTDHSNNFWWGCHKVSEACRECYIKRWMKWKGLEPFNGPIRTSKATWRKPLAWNRSAAGAINRPRVFTCSMSDFFHPGADDWRDKAWDVIRICNNLDWLILAKRPELIRDRLPGDWGDGYSHVWLGVTVESQKHIGRLDVLATISAAIHFVSAEPLLGPIRFGRRIRKLDWAITGCEQAHKDRRQLMDFDWVRGIRDQCTNADVPLFHKQYYVGNQIQTDGLLDGVVRQQWPQSTA